MTVSLEQIELLREKAHVSYEEAKEALEKSNGDIIDALIYLEKQDKIKPPSKESSALAGFWATVKKIVRTCHETRLVLGKQGETIIDLPMTVVILITIFAPPITVIGLLVALFTGYKIRIKRPGGQELKINKTLDDISAAASKMGEQVAGAVNRA